MYSWNLRNPWFDNNKKVHIVLSCSKDSKVGKYQKKRVIRKLSGDEIQRPKLNVKERAQFVKGMFYNVPFCARVHVVGPITQLLAVRGQRLTVDNQTLEVVIECAFTTAQYHRQPLFTNKHLNSAGKRINKKQSLYKETGVSQSLLIALQNRIFEHT